MTMDMEKILLLAVCLPGVMFLPLFRKVIWRRMSTVWCYWKVEPQRFFSGLCYQEQTLSVSPRHLLRHSAVPPRHVDMNLHGEERACVNCGLCDKKCPVDLFPQFIMKAVHAGEMEEGIELGMLDCTLCGLCSYVCPSKIDLVQLFSMAKDLYYRDRVEM